MLSDLDELPTIQLGDFTLQFEMDELSPEMQEVARKELRETPDVKRDAVVALRDLLKGEFWENSRHFYVIAVLEVSEEKNR